MCRQRSRCSGSSNINVFPCPSFNALRVPYSFSVNSVAQPTGGHEKVKTKISAKQLHAVAAWIAQVTRQNPILAKPTDG